MTIYPHEWPEWHLLVSVKNRQSNTNNFLLKNVSHEEFIEHWLGVYEEDRDKRIYSMDVTPLNEAAYDLLVPLYPAENVIEG